MDKLRPYILFALIIFVVHTIFSCEPAKAGPAAIFNGNVVKLLKPGASLNGFVNILAGSTSPQSVAVNAPAGSLYLQYGSSGNAYVKMDNGTSTNWSLISTGGGGGGTGAYTVYGSTGSPVVVSSSGISSTSQQRQLYIVKTSSGAVNVTANPQITAGTVVGQELVIMGTSSSNYPIFSNGNGLSLNGTANITDNATLNLIWNGTVWSEQSRR